MGGGGEGGLSFGMHNIYIYIYVLWARFTNTSFHSPVYISMFIYVGICMNKISFGSRSHKISLNKTGPEAKAKLLWAF